MTAADTSLLARHVTGYLTLRRSLGDKLDDQQPVLTQLQQRLDQSRSGGATGADVTVDAVLAWATEPGRRGDRTRPQIARRLTVARGFARYLHAYEPQVQIPPPNLIPPQVVRTTPWIFSTDEVTALMAAASRLTPALWSATLQTLIGLMTATGIRTSEAFRLARDDLNLHEQTLAVRHSKYGKSRTLPLHPSTLGPLAAYRDQRDHTEPASGCFFVDARGSALDARGVPVGATFTRLLAEVGLRPEAGQRAPRLHDLRHTFAVATLRDWHLSLVDTQPRLAELSAYLGHVNPSHTYWYLQAVPELLEPVAARLDQHLTEQAVLS